MTGNVWGRPYIPPGVALTTGPGTAVRGGNSLVQVAENAPAGDRVRSTLRVAGALRTVNIAGSAAMTGMDVANLVSRGNPIEAFKKDRAGYVADVMKTGFDASMTAALVSPSPVTWGAVGVTGVAWGTAEIVDNWDGIRKGLGSAAKATDKFVDDQVDAVKGRLDDAKDTLEDVGSTAKNLTGRISPAW